jgi:hypothetical protein
MSLFRLALWNRHGSPHMLAAIPWRATAKISSMNLSYQIISRTLSDMAVKAIFPA